jgi:hypothetical protein
MPRVGTPRQPKAPPNTGGHVIVSEIIRACEQQRRADRRCAWAIDAIKERLTDMIDRLDAMRPKLIPYGVETVETAYDVVETLPWNVATMHVGNVQRWANAGMVARVEEALARVRWEHYTGDDRTAAQQRLDAFEASRTEDDNVLP